MEFRDGGWKGDTAARRGEGRSLQEFHIEGGRQGINKSGFYLMFASMVTTLAIQREWDILQM